MEAQELRKNNIESNDKEYLVVGFVFSAMFAFQASMGYRNGVDKILLLNRILRIEIVFGIAVFLFVGTVIMFLWKAYRKVKREKTFFSRLLAAVKNAPENIFLGGAAVLTMLEYIGCHINPNYISVAWVLDLVIFLYFFTGVVFVFIVKSKGMLEEEM